MTAREEWREAWRCRRGGSGARCSRWMLRAAERLGRAPTEAEQFERIRIRRWAKLDPQKFRRYCREVLR